MRMPLEEGPQRRMYSVMESYDELLESLCRRRWAMVHPSNLFRNAHDHDPFSTVVLATTPFHGDNAGGTGATALAPPGPANRTNVHMLSSAKMIRSSSLGQSPLVLQTHHRTQGGRRKRHLHVNSTAATHPTNIGANDHPASTMATTAAARVSELIWELGVPTDRRKAVYMLLSGAAALARQQGSEHYRMLVRRSDRQGGLHSVDAAQIDVDIPPHLARRLSARSCDPPQKIGREVDVDIASPLRRVLRAFATSHRAVGYCQAMNFIAARFLLS